MKLYNPEHELAKRIDAAIELPTSKDDLFSDIMSDFKSDKIRSCNEENFQFENARAKLT